jgi:hypothetical protein
MNMALQTDGTTRVTNNGELANISGTDSVTDSAINTAIKNQNNVLRIYNAAGTEVKTLFCAQN